MPRGFFSSGRFGVKPEAAGLGLRNVTARRRLNASPVVQRWGEWERPCGAPVEPCHLWRGCPADLGQELRQLGFHLHFAYIADERIYPVEHLRRGGAGRSKYV